jgi:cytidylate kinase
VGGVADTGVDRDSLQQFTARVIQKAARAGNCVIVGRGSQCVLRENPQVLHVLIYAPLAEKLDRMKHRHPRERDLPGLLRRMDAERLRYADEYFSCNSADRGLYHLCLNSTLGIDACADVVAETIRVSATSLRPQEEETHV